MAAIPVPSEALAVGVASLTVGDRQHTHSAASGGGATSAIRNGGPCQSFRSPLRRRPPSSRWLCKAQQTKRKPPAQQTSKQHKSKEKHSTGLSKDAKQAKPAQPRQNNRTRKKDAHQRPHKSARQCPRSISRDHPPHYRPKLNCPLQAPLAMQYDGAVAGPRALPGLPSPRPTWELRLWPSRSTRPSFTEAYLGATPVALTLYQAFLHRGLPGSYAQTHPKEVLRKKPELEGSLDSASRQ